MWLFLSPFLKQKVFCCGFLLLNNWQYIIWDSICLFSDYSELPCIVVVWKPEELKDVSEVPKM